MIGTVQTQKMFFAMGTVNTITVFDEADEALSAAKERVKDLDRKLSAYSHDSEIYSINSHAGIAPVAVSMDTFRLIKHSVMYSRLTDGQALRFGTARCNTCGRLRRRARCTCDCRFHNGYREEHWASETAQYRGNVHHRRQKTLRH